MKITKRKLIISIVALVLVSVIVFGFVFSGKQYGFSKKEFGEFYKAKTVPPSKTDVLWNEDGYTVLGETNRLLLEFSKNGGDFRVTDKENGNIFSSSFDETKLESVPKNKKLRQGLVSVCSIAFADKEGVTDIVNSADSSVKLNTQALKDGINLKYNFTKQDIQLEFNIWVENENLVVDFSSDSVKESGDCYLMSVDILPMLMSATDNDDGYIVYPEGSGALYRWGESDTTRTTILTRDIWSERNIDIDAIDEQANAKLYGILIPAMGVKRTDGSVVGFIEQGAEYCSATLATAKYMFGVNRVYPSAIYRKTGTYVGANGTEYTQIDENTSIENITVRYAFSGSNSDYSDMAGSVRDMMISSGDLLQSKKTPYSMKLDIINGAVEETVLYSSYKTATTLKGAQEMTKYLKDNGVEGVAIELLGWQKEGYGLYPASGELESKIGRLKDLTELSDFAKGMNSKLYLSVNLINASSNQGGFSKRSDVIFDATDIGITDKSGTNYILNPYMAFKSKNSDIINKLSKTGISGVSYEGIGKLLYEDYNSKSAMSRTDTIAVHKAMLKASADNYSGAIAQHGNSYVLSVSDMVTDVPAGTSAYPALAEEIPFYQLIVHGNVAYTLNTVANLSYDLDSTKLRWLEYGAVPYFVMSDKGSEMLNATQAGSIYSSSFSDWKSEIVEIYNEFAPMYNEISSAQMIDHQKLSQGVYKTTYEGNKSVIVNYNDSPYQYGEKEIAAKSYLFQ